MTTLSSFLYPSGQAGLPGEVAFTGLTKITDSGGYVYSRITNTGVGNGGFPPDGSPTNFVTLNKGTYLVTYFCMAYSTGAEGRLSMKVRVGTTYIHTGAQPANRLNGSFECAVTESIPVVITEDATIVAIYGACLGAGLNSSGSEMYAVRLTR